MGSTFSELHLVNKWKKAFGFALVVSFLTFSYYFLDLDYLHLTFNISPSIQESNASVQGYLVHNNGCHMPSWDPFDLSIKIYYENVSVPYVCSHKPSFLVIRPNATVILNKTVLFNYFNLDPLNLTCKYKTILRDAGTSKHPTDDKFVYSKSKKLDFGVALNTEFIYVKCSDSRSVVYEEYLALTPLKNEVEKHREETKKNRTLYERLNVIMIGIDSISKLNFIRHFSKTRKLLRELKAIELKGYNKVGDNTFPNLVPMLTGHFREWYYNESMPDFFFDKLDFVWKHFGNIGYRTLLSEDAPEIATFNYKKNGFRHPPTDYYPRPFALAVEKSSMKRQSKSFCFNDRMEFKVYLDYLQSFISTMEDRPYFAFTFQARLTHDVLNFAAYADEPSFDILQNLHYSNITNNSVIFFFSDHGIRFGPIRQTYIGKFEERWPFMFILFPGWFLKQYSSIADNLLVNQERLTTPFDIHETLLDIRHIVTNGRLRGDSGDLQQIGKSLLKEVSQERTCSDAGIYPHWCTCHTLSRISSSNKNVLVAAQRLIDYINSRLKNTSLCVELSLKGVIDSYMAEPEDKLLRYSKGDDDIIHLDGPRDLAPVDYTISLTASPSEAVFEGTIRYDPKNQEYTVMGEISRLNLYGHQSDCLRDAELGKYCYCKDQP